MFILVIQGDRKNWDKRRPGGGAGSNYLCFTLYLLCQAMTKVKLLHAKYVISGH